MTKELLVRAYDVGAGDFIHVIVPDDESEYHIVIDCGTKENPDHRLRDAIRHMIARLPADDSPGSKRLDLLVATHPHDDHIKGFDPAWFKTVNIKRIWLSALMRETHTQGESAHGLQGLVSRMARSLSGRRVGLTSAQRHVLVNSLSRATATKALCKTLPEQNGIKPLYVYRTVADLDQDACAEHDLFYDHGTTCLGDFEDAGTCLRVLGPEWDIDRVYLGRDPDGPGHGFKSLLPGSRLPSDSASSSQASRGSVPTNISLSDFRRLRERLSVSALSFLANGQKLENNTSIVLLLEWRGHRLLFTGDAEWEGKLAEDGRRNGGWDVVLREDQAEGHLSLPLDFLKVAHHGSHNGTPFEAGAAEQPFLNQLMPEDGETRVVVSTGEWYSGVPDPALMEELGRRAANAYIFADEPEFGQPERTDLGGMQSADGVWFVEERFASAGE